MTWAMTVSILARYRRKRYRLITNHSAPGTAVILKDVLPCRSALRVLECFRLWFDPLMTTFHVFVKQAAHFASHCFEPIVRNLKFHVICIIIQFAIWSFILDSRFRRTDLVEVTTLMSQWNFNCEFSHKVVSHMTNEERRVGNGCCDPRAHK